MGSHWVYINCMSKLYIKMIKIVFSSNCRIHGPFVTCSLCRWGVVPEAVLGSPIVGVFLLVCHLYWTDFCINLALLASLENVERGVVTGSKYSTYSCRVSVLLCPCFTPSNAMHGCYRGNMWCFPRNVDLCHGLVVLLWFSCLSPRIYGINLLYPVLLPEGFNVVRSSGVIV